MKFEVSDQILKNRTPIELREIKKHVLQIQDQISLEMYTPISEVLLGIEVNNTEMKNTEHDSPH